MKFYYETQGATTYMVCELDPGEQVDSLTLGMLTNNRINGLAPVLYTEMDGQRFLKYNVSAKVAVSQFFSGSMSKQRTMQAFQSILNALCSADDYMIDQNCFTLKPDHVFLNVSNCEAALICIPVVTDNNVNEEAAALFKQILFTAQFDTNEDAGYITQMLSYVNGGSKFTVYGFRDLVQRLSTENPSPMAAAPQMQSAPMGPTPGMPVAPPVSSFDSTVSFYDSPGMTGGMNPNFGGYQRPMQQNNPPQYGYQQPQQSPYQPPMQSAPQQNPYQPPMQNSPRPNPYQQMPPQQMPPQQMPPQQMPQQNPYAAKQPAVPNPKPVQGKKAPGKGNAGPAIPGQNKPAFAIPGQGNQGFAVPGQNKPAAEPAQQASAEQDDKKMSFFSLMMHYNKENAAIYKAQKDTKKGVQPASKPEKPPKQPKQPKNQKGMQQPPQAPFNGPQQPGMPNMGMPGMGGMPQQPAYRPQMQPLPVQNSFNETTVLSPVSSETTVLSDFSMNREPCLIRTKTGERIIINKPVFRIGKEKSYVDYFIADNTAISRSHCNIHNSDGECFIEDTNSTNHTYVNGAIINSNVKVKLNSGDKVRLANEDFTFTM